MVGTRLRLPEGLTSVSTVRQLALLLQATMPSQATVRGRGGGGAEGGTAASAVLVGGRLAASGGRVRRAYSPRPPPCCPRAPTCLVRLLTASPLPLTYVFLPPGPQPSPENQQGPAGGSVGARGHSRRAGQLAARLRGAHRRRAALQLPAGRLRLRRARRGHALRAGARTLAGAGAALHGRPALPRTHLRATSLHRSTHHGVPACPCLPLPPRISSPHACPHLSSVQGPDGVLALSGLQRLGPNEAPLLLRRDGPLCTLYLQAEAAWAAPRHEGWVVLNVAGARYQVHGRGQRQRRAGGWAGAGGAPLRWRSSLAGGAQAAANVYLCSLMGAPGPPCLSCSSLPTALRPPPGSLPLPALQTVEELEAALADEVRGQPVLEQLQSEPAAPAAPAALDQAAAQQVAAGTEQAGPQGAAPAPASPGEEAPKVVRTFALTLAGNPVSLAAAPSGGNSLSTATATEAQKRPHSSMSADGGQQQQQQQQAERAAKRRTSPLPWQQQRQQQQQQQQSSEHGPEGLSMHAEHRSLDSPTSQQGNASQGGHMAALPLQQPPVPLPQSLQRQPAALQLPSRPPALQLQAQHLPQQQQLQQSQHQLHQEQHHQLLQHLMSSAPTVSEGEGICFFCLGGLTSMQAPCTCSAKPTRPCVGGLQAGCPPLPLALGRICQPFATHCRSFLPPPAPPEQAPFQPLSQQEQQQAELLQLLCRLTQAPAPAPAPAPPAPAFHLPPSGRSAFHHPPHAPSQGFDAAASLRLLQGMTGAAAGAGAAPSAEFAVQSLPTQPWAPSLEQLAQIFARQ